MRRTKFLLDTHIVLWAIFNDKRVNPTIESIMLNPENDIYYSIASMWEVQIKYGLKKMPVSGIDFMHSCEQAGYKKLPLEDIHIAELTNLQRDEKAPAHNDPFDRILLSQAKAEGFYFVTHDPMFRGYNENCVIEV